LSQLNCRSNQRDGPSEPNVFADALYPMQMGNHSRNPLKNLDLSVFEEEPES